VKRTKRVRFDTEKHQALGQELFAIRNRLSSIAIEFEIGYGVSAKITKKARRATKGLDDLKCEADNLLDRDCPDLTPQERNRVYYSERKG